MGVRVRSDMCLLTHAQNRPGVRSVVKGCVLRQEKAVGSRKHTKREKTLCCIALFAFSWSSVVTACTALSKSDINVSGNGVPETTLDQVSSYYSDLHMKDHLTDVRQQLMSF